MAGGYFKKGGGNLKGKKIIQVFDAICTLMLITLVLLALSQVLFRYVLKISVPWTEELARMFYSFLIFTGVTLVEGENGQMKTTFFLEKVPEKARFVIQGIINGLSIIFCGGLILGAVKMALSSWSYRMGSLPFISTAIVYVPIIICMPFVIYFLIIQMVYFKEYFLEYSDYDIN